MNWKYYIPERFEKAIVLHALRNYNANIQHAPLMLAIDGPAGEGKTYQCELVLRKMGIEVFSLSSGQFESKDAGEPAKLIRDTYDRCIKYVKSSSNNYAAIIIDDADVAFGNWGNQVQYTVNTQNVIGELMNIANIPIVNSAEKSPRVPIYLTGNNLKRIYAPLRRSGRMDFFFWQPTISEKAHMIFYLFDCLKLEECYKLILYTEAICKKKNLDIMPMSFYSSVLSHMWDFDLWNAYTINKNTCFHNNYLPNVINLSEYTNISLDILKKQVDQILFQLQKSQINHIETSERWKHGINTHKYKH